MIVDPFCVACGDLVGWEEIFGSRAAKECERETPDPKSQVVWGSICRSIYQATKDSPYPLSGITRVDTMALHSLVPLWDRDSDKSDHGSGVGIPPGATLTGLTSFLPQDDWDEYPLGFPIHANCWVFIERIIGPKAEERLDLFVEVLRQRWQQHPFGIDQYRNEEFDDEEPLIEGPSWAFPEHGAPGVPLDYDDKKYYDPHHWYNRTVSDLTTRNISCLRDPIKIPRLHDLIRRCIRDRAREEMKRKARNWHLTSTDGNTDHLVPGSLSLDVALCILDNLSGRDIRNTLLAFGWKLPEAYYRARFPKELIFEIEDIEPDKIDWKGLFLGVEELRESSPEMENRERIFRILEGTKELFASTGGFDGAR